MMFKVQVAAVVTVVARSSRIATVAGLLAGTALAVGPGMARAQTVEDRVNAITEKYAPDWQRIRERGEHLGDYKPSGAAAALNVDVVIGTSKIE